MFYLVCVPALHGAFSAISNFSIFGWCCCCSTWYSILFNRSMFYLKSYNIHVMFPCPNTNALFNTCIIWNWKLNSCNFTPNDDGTKEIACSFHPKKFNCVQCTYQKRIWVEKMKTLQVFLHFYKQHSLGGCESLMWVPPFNALVRFAYTFQDTYFIVCTQDTRIGAN